MPVYLTLLGLLGMTAVAISLRLLWPRTSSRTRHILLLTAAILCLPAFAPLLLKWETTSEPVNTALLWLRLFAYELCVVFFTLLRPRWLTCIVAVILTLPLFSSSIVGPLGGALQSGAPVVRPISGGYFLELLPWSSGPAQNTGADLVLFYQPPSTRLFRRSFVGIRLYDSQCRTPATFATVNPAIPAIDVHCPPLTTDPKASPSGTELHYVIPPGVRSPELAPNPRQ